MTTEVTSSPLALLPEITDGHLYLHLSAVPTDPFEDPEHSLVLGKMTWSRGGTRVERLEFCLMGPDQDLSWQTLRRGLLRRGGSHRVVAHQDDRMFTVDPVDLVETIDGLDRATRTRGFLTLLAEHPNWVAEGVSRLDAQGYLFTAPPQGVIWLTPTPSR